MTFQRHRRAAARLAGAVALCSGMAWAADEPTYNRDIRPILAEHCFVCHGQDAAVRKAGLRLDQADGATAPLRSGHAALVPGDAASSVLMQRIQAGEADRMPPAHAGRALNADEIAKLQAWIDAGAAYEPHWAYVAPERPALPEVARAEWPANPIDRFVLARLEGEGLEPAPEADSYTLIRRLYLDLTGLPPTPEAADAFVNDARPDRLAYAVDRLLADPAFGEHWARHWLDLARYADTNGYHIDAKRTMWPYRDWVIHAFNRNMPFDQFTIEQIAGDLLPNADASQRIATGFHRNTLFNEEGGIDQEEFRTKAVVDRVNTTMATWMGTTMSCAECHDHKYDPFTQAEFYELYAFFNNVPELGGGTGQSMAPLETLPLPADAAAKREGLLSVRAGLEAEWAQEAERLRAELPAWAEALRAQPAVWTRLHPESAASDKGSMLEVLDDGSVRASGDLPDPHIDTYVVDVPVPEDGLGALAIEVIPDESLPAGGPGRAEDGTFVVTDLAVLLDGKRLELRDARAVHAVPDREPAMAIDGDPGFKSGWSTGRAATPDSLVVQVADADVPPPGTRVRVQLTQRLSRYTLGRFRLWAQPRDGHFAAPPPHVRQALDAGQAAGDTSVLFDYYLSLQPERLDDRIAEIDAAIAEIDTSAPTSLVMAEMETPRQAHIHIRGNFLELGEPVDPGVPAVWPAPAVRGTRPDRLDLARWLVARENPLTARVTVNRVWARLFGRGLVATVEDFGTRGALPSHPELLDYLAVEFMDSGWDFKSLLRHIVTSATYRQSAAVGADAYARDPQNILLARGPRFRLDAEAIRDQALLASGLLVRKLGGPSVHPYQPPGLYEEKIQTGYGVGAWPEVYGDNLYRRGLYTFRRRSVPYPTFQTFDAPNFEYCAASRSRTNTPLQALTTLNDPQFFEAARVLAQRMLELPEASIEDRVTAAFRRCLTRPPAEREVAALRALYERQLAHYQAHPEAAERLVENGRAPVPRGLPRAEWAAWTVVANVLLNLDETIVKG